VQWLVVLSCGLQLHNVPRVSQLHGIGLLEPSAFAFTLYQSRPLTIYQVYSCEYQNLVLQYLNVCPSAREPIPFWPAPPNAPAACSCNLGRMSDYIRNITDEQVSCFSQVTSSTTAEGVEVTRRASGCACCGASARYSAYASTSPRISKTELTYAATA
jgi:hypothetical protein